MSYVVTVIPVSGPIGSGKTILTEQLTRSYSAIRLSTSSLMANLAGHGLAREELQRLGGGAHFQGGEWIVAAVNRLIAGDPLATVVVVDAVRTLAQVVALRRAGARTWRVLHVHLTSNVSQLALRYDTRRRAGDEGVAWKDAMRDPVEAQEPALEREADLVIDTSRATPDDVMIRVASRIRSARPNPGPQVDVLVGGQWGSEGKGNLAFFLAPEYDLLVRVGAPNAGHKIYGHDGVIYTHRQLPSGTRATSAPLLLGPGAVIDLDVLRREIEDCAVSAERLTIDPNALIIEVGDKTEERLLKGAIGSTGTGGGAALARRITKRGEPGAVRTAKDIPELSPYVRHSAEVLEENYARGALIFVEGTQGTSLSLIHGSFPHVTSRDTTVGALLSEIGIPPQRVRRSIVVFRAYPIRVGGRSGPMDRELSWEAVATRAGLPGAELQVTEVGSVSGNMRRVAEFSWVQLRASARLNGATDIALTFLDYLDVNNRSACRFEQLTEETIRFVEEVELVAGAPVSLISARFDGRGIIDRRQW